MSQSDPELLKRSKVPPFPPEEKAPKKKKKPKQTVVIEDPDDLYEEEAYCKEEEYIDEHEREKFVKPDRSVRYSIPINPPNGPPSTPLPTKSGSEKGGRPSGARKTGAKRREHIVKGLGEDVVEDGETDNRDRSNGRIDDECNYISEDTSTDVAKAIGAILGSDFRTQTELNKDEVRALSVLIEIAQKYRSMRLAKFAENFMACMVSFNRGSRKEVVASFNSIDQMGRGGFPSVPTMNRLRV